MWRAMVTVCCGLGIGVTGVLAAGPGWGGGGGRQARQGMGWKGGRAAADRPCGCCPRGGGAGRAWGQSAQGATTRPAGCAQPMTSAEHRNVWALLDDRASITRKVTQLSDGVESTTTTTIPTLVPILREHARQMAARLENRQPVRQWDPVFRDIFASADKITMTVTDVPDGVQVRETSGDAQAVSAIRAHAKAVQSFVDKGYAAARPPWAGRGWNR